MAKISIPDNQGNQLISDLPKIFLHVNKEKKPRQIGIIQNRVMFVVRNRKKHLHNQSNACEFEKQIFVPLPIIELYKINSLF